jgi:hypothetical protein
VLQWSSISPKRLEDFKRMRNPLPLLRLLFVVFVVSICLVWVATTTAQSGRRGKKSTTAEPASTPSPAPSPRKPDVEKATVRFIVGVYRDGFSNIPLSYYTSVAQACAERLEQGPAVKVDFASKDMTRSDAVNSARAEKEGFVVWLQLKVENMDSDQIANNLRQVYVEYTVFAATTAKTATWGHTYQQGYRKGGVVVNAPGTTRGNPGYSEHLLRQAGAEAAERILGALKIGAPPPRRFATRNPKVKDTHEITRTRESA